MKDEKEFESIRKTQMFILLANMTEFGKSKLLTTKELKNLGYNIVISCNNTKISNEKC